MVRTLDEIQASDLSFVGGKAFNCARLKQAGLPVPDGVVLTTDAMGRPVQYPELRVWLARLPVGMLLAVRSSAPEEDSGEHSFAGVHETRLNVRPEDVAEAVQACWSSVSSPAALAYRQARHLANGDSRTAVLIQRMIQPVAAGVAFTVDPVSGAEDRMLINSVAGLGESLVSGRVEPDAFAVRKTDRRILSSHISGATPSITDDQVQELAVLLSRIEPLFGSAQDVEWCYDGTQFWIVQSRPVTAAPASHKKDLEWTRANAREVLPDLASPMTIYAVADSIEKGERDYYGKFLAPESELGRMAQIFYGRLYFNLDQIRNTCKLAGTAPAVILRSLGHSGDIDPSDEVIQRRSFAEIRRIFPDLIRIGWNQLTVGRGVRRLLDRAERYLQEVQALDWKNLPDKDLWAENRKWRPRFVEELEVVFALTGVSIYDKYVREICRRVDMPYERLVYTHLAVGEKSVSSLQAFDLLRLVQIARENGGGLSNSVFRSQFDLFLKKYGHRGLYESDIAMPRFAEDPSPLLFTIQSHLQSLEPPDPDAITRRQNADAAKAWVEFEQRLNILQRLTLIPTMRWLLKRIKRFYIWRELVRSEMVRVALPLRQFHLELAGRFAERGWIDSREDYFYLTLQDVDAVVDGEAAGSSLKSIVERRKSEWQRLSKIDMPLLLRESQLSAIGRKVTAPMAADAPGSELRGLCVSAGYTEGEVVVMRDPREFSRMKPGAIIVAPATDPSWTPLFTLASGVIVEVGGILSHASTVAREYGLPALANVKHATTVLKTGDRVRLDATNGIVQQL